MTMIVLPPSEGKTTGTMTSSLRLDSLTYPELTAKREQAIRGLVSLSNGSKAKAREALGLTKNQDDEIERNKGLLTNPTAPAHEIYSGVLYDAIGMSTLTTKHMTRLADSTYVMSALYGLIRITDEIAAYRLSGNCALPKVGSLVKHWAPSIREIFEACDDFIIDMRSGTYVSLGPVSDSVNCVTPKILQKMPSGPPKVITHHNKATKGRIVRAIVSHPRPVDSVDKLAELVSGMGADVDILRSRNTVILNVVVAAI